MNTKIILMLVLAAFTAVGISGCNLLKKRIELKEKATYSINGKSKTGISIENTNGEIRVTKSDDTTGTIIINTEKISRVKQDDKDKPIENLKVNIDSAGNYVRITTEYNKITYGLFNHSNDDGRVNYEVRVPANMKVDLKNTNGSITITGLANDVKVETVNGSINLNHCNGNISASGTNGSISGNIDSTKGISIDVVNGSVKLGGLKNVSAQVNVKTENGRVKFNNLTFSNLNSEKRNLTGTLGSGGSLIKVTSVNGGITLDANDVSFSKQWHDDDYNFKIDFDDDDDSPVKITKENSKSVDTQKAPEIQKAK